MGCFLLVMLVLVVILQGAVRAFGLSRGHNAAQVDLYECGFLALLSLDAVIHARFFVVGVLFLVFDLELVIMLPLVLA